MAEVTAMRNNALNYPVYAVAYTVVFPMLDADGDLVTGATTPDAEVSKNGDTFADCTNESTEIATNSGVYYLTLTATEMTADIVTVIAKSATAGMKTTTIVLYPRKLAILSTGTCQGANDTGDIQLASGDSAVDDVYNGCLVVAVIDTVTEARIINDYVGSTKVAEISPAWNTAAPDNNDTYTIYQPEGRGALLHAANAIQWNSLATVALPLVPATAGRTLVVDAAGLADANVVKLGPTGSGTAQTARDVGLSVLLSSGTGTGQISLNSGAVLLQATQTGVTIPIVTTVTNQLTAAAIATGVRTELTTELARVDAAVSSRMATYVQPTGFLAATFPTTVASTTNITAGTITTVTTLSNLPAAPTDWLTAAAVSAAAVTKIQSGLSTYGGADTAGTTTLLARLTGARAGYLDNVNNATLAAAVFPTDPADQSLVIAATDAIITALTLKATQASVDDLPTNAELTTALGTADDAVLVQVALVKAKTDLIPAAPAAAGDVPTAAVIADTVLRRRMANVEASSDGDAISLHSLYGMIQMAQAASVSGTTLTVKKVDLSTTLGTLTITASAGADPITGVSG